MEHRVSSPPCTSPVDSSPEKVKLREGMKGAQRSVPHSSTQGQASASGRARVRESRLPSVYCSVVLYSLRLRLRIRSSTLAVFMPGLKGGKVLIWEKGTFVRGLLRALLRVILHFEGTMALPLPLGMGK